MLKYFNSEQREVKDVSVWELRGSEHFPAGPKTAEPMADVCPAAALSVVELVALIK